MGNGASCAHESLCWKCTRPGTGTCSWDKNLTPVPGWDATAVLWRDKPGEYIRTWHVNACPLFCAVSKYDYRMTHVAGQRPRRKAGRPPKYDMEALSVLFRNGWRDYAIAKELHVSPATVSRYRKRWEHMQGRGT